MNALRRIGPLVLLALGVALAAAAGSHAAQPPVLHTAGTVSLLAADGSRVAVATTGIKGKCDQIVVWDTRAATTYTAGTNCAGNGGSLPEWVARVALAGTTVAWVERTAGNREDLTLNVASPAWKAPKLAAYLENGNGASGLVEGDYIGGLYGAGTLIAYDTWHVCTLEPPGANDPYGIDEPCTGTHAPVAKRSHSVDLQRVWRLAGASKKAVTSGAGTFPVVAVDATRIAVRTPSGAVELLSPDGSPLDSFPVLPGTLSGAALDRTQLAVIQNGELRVYPNETVRPVPAKATLCGFTGTLAAYRSGSSVTVVRLGDGKTEHVAASLCALTRAGLFTASGHSIAFLPTAGLLRN